MAALKYTVIKNRTQYNTYCDLLEELVTRGRQRKGDQDEIELLTTLIGVWDREHDTGKKLDPIQLLRSLISDHQLKPGAVMKIMGIASRGHYSEIMRYQRGLSKEVIRNLAAYFKLAQEAFNRPYALKPKTAKKAVHHAA